MSDCSGALDFAKMFDVSRETIEALHHYGALIAKWNSTINLVSPRSLTALWSRHFCDSAQLYSCARESGGRWGDLGSGGGFPGLVVAILAREHGMKWSVTLVEADQRKAAFLRTVARELTLEVRVVTDRIERLAPLRADVLSARALAPLPVLLGYVGRHLAVGGRAYLLKGANHLREVEAARREWRFDLEVISSRTDPAAAILSVGDVSHA